MAQKKNETEVSTSETSSVKKEKQARLRNTTILAGVLVVGAVAIWSVVANRWNDLSTESKPMGAVAATINGEPIYVSEVESIARQMPQLAELPFDMIYPKLLNEMINDRVLRQAAIDSKLEENPIVQKRLKVAHDQILSQSYLFNKLSDTATEEELKKLYLEKIKDFKGPEEIHARHILVKTPKEAQDILIQLKAGADFQMLANTKSLDAESNNGGDLGYFQKDMMIPEFSEPVFALKKGQISAPIKTPFGWHIVLVEDRRLSAPPAFEDVKDQLRQLIFEKNKDAVIAQERARYKVDVITKSLNTQSLPSMKDVVPTTEVADQTVAEEVPTVEEEKAVETGKNEPGKDMISEEVPSKEVIPQPDNEVQ